MANRLSLIRYRRLAARLVKYNSTTIANASGSAKLFRKHLAFRVTNGTVLLNDLTWNGITPREARSSLHEAHCIHGAHYFTSRSPNKKNGSVLLTLSSLRRTTKQRSSATSTQLTFARAWFLSFLRILLNHVDGLASFDALKARRVVHIKKVCI